MERDELLEIVREEIFEKMMQVGRMVPQETLFVDDSKANCKTAAELKVKTFNVVSNSDWTTDIDKILERYE